jgi:hypothetical protein
MSNKSAPFGALLDNILSDIQSGAISFATDLRVARPLTPLNRSVMSSDKSIQRIYYNTVCQA